MSGHSARDLGRRASCDAEVAMAARALRIPQHVSQRRRPLERFAVLLPASRRERPREEFQRIVLPLVVTELARTCLWRPDGLGSDWKLGDHNFLILEFSPRRNVCLYLQWWSEPGEPVIVEVCSGKRNPTARPWITTGVRARLRARGFRRSKDSPNLRKGIPGATAASIVDLAYEALDILWDEFGYRGHQALRGHSGRGERARTAYVFDALTPGDVARLFEAEGCVCTTANERTDVPMVSVVLAAG
jgi:hypothetical protein